jgi:hypothetical protein
VFQITVKPSSSVETEQVIVEVHDVRFAGEPEEINRLVASLKVHINWKYDDDYQVDASIHDRAGVATAMESFLAPVE